MCARRCQRGRTRRIRRRRLSSSMFTRPRALLTIHVRSRDGAGKNGARLGARDVSDARAREGSGRPNVPRAFILPRTIFLGTGYDSAAFVLVVPSASTRFERRLGVSSFGSGRSRRR